MKKDTIIQSEYEGFKEILRYTQNDENGRSMVEMLGVLAIIGVLSIAGIAGYKTAMTKYRTNELLEEVTKLAIIVASKISLNGLKAPTTPSTELIDEFTDPKNYGFQVSRKNDNQFNILIDAVDESVCTQMKSLIEMDSPIQWISDDCTELTFNNNLSTVSQASDYTTEEECKKLYKWCSESNSCVESDCCSGKNNQCCNSDTGNTSNYENNVCNFNGGKENGICQGGRCIEDFTERSCNPNHYDGNLDCGGINSSYYCCTQKHCNPQNTCHLVSSEQRISGKLRTDLDENRGTDWRTAMSFCAAIGKKVPSLEDIKIEIPESECYLSDCPDGGILTKGGECVTSTTLSTLQARFNNNTHTIWLSNQYQSGGSSYVVQVGGAAAGYVYVNDKTSSAPLAVCE